MKVNTLTPVSRDGTAKEKFLKELKIDPLVNTQIRKLNSYIADMEHLGVGGKKGKVVKGYKLSTLR